jgi:hypothetical protein
MIPDLRFIIGAVTAAALMGVTLFGFVATVHIAQQSKVGPLEASRLLAYTSDDWNRIEALQAARRFGAASPRAEPSDSALLEPPAAPSPEPAAPPLQTAALTHTADTRPDDIALTVRVAAPSDNTDSVDERAVVDPPLPADTDAPAATPEVPLRDIPHRDIQQQDVLHVGSIPAAPDTSEAREETPTKTSRARKVRRHARHSPATIAPLASTGYPVRTMPNASRPTKSLWPGDID